MSATNDDPDPGLIFTMSFFHKAFLERTSFILSTGATLRVYRQFLAKVAGYMCCSLPANKGFRHASALRGTSMLCLRLN